MNSPFNRRAVRFRPGTFRLMLAAFMASASPASHALASDLLSRVGNDIRLIQFSSGSGGSSDCESQRDEITQEGEQKAADTDPNNQCAVAQVITWKEEQELAWAQDCAPNYLDQLQAALQQAQDQQTQACQ